MFLQHTMCISNQDLLLHRSFCGECLNSNIISSEMNSYREDFLQINLPPQTLHYHLLFSSSNLFLTEIIFITYLIIYLLYVSLTINCSLHWSMDLVCVVSLAVSANLMVPDIQLMLKIWVKWIMQKVKIRWSLRHRGVKKWNWNTERYQEKSPTIYNFWWATLCYWIYFLSFIWYYKKLHAFRC